MTTDCRPHEWKLPVVGDDALVCQRCERVLDFHREVTPNMRSSILNVQERFGHDYAEEFRVAYDATVDDVRQRCSRCVPG